MNSTQSQIAIDLEGISKNYGDVVALDNVSASIKDSEFFTLLGPSGCGKTTLLRIVAGFESVSAGNIRLYGNEIRDLPANKRPVNTVFQQYSLFPHMTVLENVKFGLQMQGRDRAFIDSRSAQMLELVQLESFADRKSSQLSGGQQQRVALARALAPQPKVLLLDEPLSALDLKLRQSMRMELKQIQQQTGITFVFVTHDQDEALTMSDRLAVMNEGRILQVGEPRDIYDHPSMRFVADFIGETNFLNVDVLSADENNNATIQLASGVTTAARTTDANTPAGQATAAVRPEHAVLCDEHNALLSGTLEEVIYSGTDTHYHVRLSDNTRFVVRKQNHPGTTEQITPGSTIGIHFDAGVAQVLKD